MTKTKNGLWEVLERHGVKDPSAFLADRGETVRAVRSKSPEVRMRGSVRLMKKGRTSRDKVQKGLDSLKYL